MLGWAHMLRHLQDRLLGFNSLYSFHASVGRLRYGRLRAVRGGLSVYGWMLQLRRGHDGSFVRQRMRFLLLFVIFLGRLLPERW